MLARETEKGAGRSNTQHKDTKAHRCNIKFLDKNTKTPVHINVRWGRETINTAELIVTQYFLYE